AIQSMKQRPKKRAVFWTLLIVAVLIGIFIWVRRGQLTSEDNSKRWRNFLLLENFDSMRQGSRDYTAKAARFETAWWFLWDKGIKSLGREHVMALKNLDDVEQEYENLARLCKDDPVYLPEALYALAVIEEARAIRDRKH